MSDDAKLQLLLDTALRNVIYLAQRLGTKLSPALLGGIRQQLVPILRAAYLRGRLSKHLKKKEDFDNEPTGTWIRRKPFGALPDTRRVLGQPEHKRDDLGRANAADRDRGGD